jgi:hypothetical protein
MICLLLGGPKVPTENAMSMRNIITINKLGKASVKTKVKQVIEAIIIPAAHNRFGDFLSDNFPERGPTIIYIKE